MTYPDGIREAFVGSVHCEIRRRMRRRFGILFGVASASMLGVAACGGVQEQVQEQVDQEVQGVQDQVEEELQGVQDQVEEEVQGGRTQIEEQIQEGQKQVEEAIEGQ